MLKRCSETNMNMEEMLQQADPTLVCAYVRMRKLYSAKAVVLLVIAGIFVLLSSIYSSKFFISLSPNAESWQESIKMVISHSVYDIWPLFRSPVDVQALHEWFQTVCLPERMEISIDKLSTVLKQWQLSSNGECRLLLATFHTLYSVSVRNGSVILPIPFRQKVKQWLGNDDTLFQHVFHQKIIHVVNRFTRDHTIFTPLRAKRPVFPPDVLEAEYFAHLLNVTAKNCDFCHYKQYTAEDTFHRVENEYAFSASNTFKIDALHALFSMRQHDPLAWPPKAFMGLMEVTLAWFAKAKEITPDARFPSVVWDVLPKCGASQVHPHMHGFLDSERYHGVVESWRQSAQGYYKATGRNFFTDSARCAASMGLAVSHRSAVAFASLVPRKDHEVVVMAPNAGRDFFEMIFFVLRAFIDDIHNFCFSMGMAYPAMHGFEAVIPAYARMITRGVVSDIRSDISSLELFAATNVDTDPFSVARLLKNSKEKRHSMF